MGEGWGVGLFAQSTTTSDDGFTVTDNTFNPNAALDSLHASHKEVPIGSYEWTVDERFGDITPVERDTAMHLFQNTIFTTGKYGEYNTTGNIGDPRINRIATDRNFDVRDPFLEPYSFFITKPSDLHFTNTLSPLTNLYYTACGSTKTGEDHLKVTFATNVNKQLGVGFRFNYIYGYGFYQNQNTALFDFTYWTSYIGERYQAHLSFAFDHMKVMENGGITNDDYITHPEEFKETYSEDELPTILSQNYNKQDAFHVNFAHRYNIGFYRKVPMTEMEKEAKRFALRSKEAQDSKKDQTEGGRRDAEHSKPSDNKKSFSGRPDDALIMGNLPKDAKERQMALNDSVLKHMRDSISAAAAAPADTSWMKDEYVPVTSLIHSVAFKTNDRRYESSATPANFYLNRYNVPIEGYPGDSINDITKYYTLRNTFALGLLEGFNKWVPMGLKAFITHELNHYEQPDTLWGYSSTTENNVYVGGEILKTLGKTIHYKAVGELGIVGKNIGDLRLDGEGDLNMRLFGDTAQVRLKAFYHLTTPNYFQRHYCGRFFFWDHDGFNKQMQTHLEAEFTLKRTRTRLRGCYDNIQNYVFLGVGYDKNISGETVTVSNYTADMMQTSANISLITLELEQNFRYGILNWENRLTYQKSSQQSVLPVPDFNAWTNLYLNFRIAKVLHVNFGADLRYFTEYDAPEYCPQVGQFAVQQNDAVRTKVGNAPIINVYANLKLKKCRFFFMMSNITSEKKAFYTPHYPLNSSTFRFGLSWDFIN